MRQRCYECFRPLSHCFCDAIPTIANRTDVLILQHIGERDHAFNTARIVGKALQRCHIATDHNRRFGMHDLPIQAHAGLLYPSDDAPVLTELADSERPSQLVIIDGTWPQAKTIVRDVPQLRDLPRYRLAPTSPGQYRIRREPNEFSLSTLEATVAALRALEPGTAGLDQLLTAFNTMVENQMGHPESHAAWRKKKSRGPRFIPPSLLLQPDNVVVAYGEATPGQLGKANTSPTPVNWRAHRVGSNERFAATLQQQQPLSADALKYMRLSPTDFDNAVTQAEFRDHWADFLRPNDVVVVYHQRTFELLRRVDAAQPRCLVLKSIFGQWQKGFLSLEELMAIEGLALPTVDNTSRSEQRLEMAVTLVEHLRSRYCQPPQDVGGLP